MLQKLLSSFTSSVLALAGMAFFALVLAFALSILTFALVVLFAGSLVTLACMSFLALMFTFALFFSLACMALFALMISFTVFFTLASVVLLALMTLFALMTFLTGFVLRLANLGKSASDISLHGLLSDSQLLRDTITESIELLLGYDFLNESLSI